MKQFKSWLVLAGAVLALAACGGGGAVATTPTRLGAGRPARRSCRRKPRQSVSGWIGYLARLIKATDGRARRIASRSLRRTGAQRRPRWTTRASPRRRPEYRTARNRTAASPPQAATLFRVSVPLQLPRAAPETLRARGLQSEACATHKDWEGHHGYDTANDRHHHRHLIGRARHVHLVRIHHEARHQPRFFFACRNRSHDHDHVARRFAPRVCAARRRWPRWPRRSAPAWPRRRSPAAWTRGGKPKVVDLSHRIDARRQAGHRHRQGRRTGWRSSATRRRTCWPTR